MIAGFDRPFRRSELVGYFTWKEDLTEALRRALPWLMHACHNKQYRSFERRNELYLRSTFDVKGGCDSCSTYECVWTSLQAWHETHGHNHFGPFTVKMPLGVLDGRRFYVFERQLNGWRHYYLVQRETTVPLFGYQHRADRLSPKSLFQVLESKARLGERQRTQYEIVLTESVDLTEARFVPTEHYWCATRQCSGSTKSEARAILEETINEELKRLARRFPHAKQQLLKVSARPRTKTTSK